MDRKVKILFTVNRLSGGGVAKSVVDVVNSLDTQRFDTTLVAMIGGVFANKLKSNIKYRHYFNENTIRLFYLMLNRFPKKLLYRMLFHEKYDIEVAYATVMAPIIQNSSNRYSKKIVYQHVQDGDMPVAYYRSFDEMKDCFNRFDGVVCVSNSVRDDYLKRMGNVNNSIVLYNILDTKDIELRSQEQIDGHFISNDKIRIVSCGRLSKEKGFDRLINVSQKLLLDGIDHELWIIGSGSESDNLKRHIELMQLQDTVTLLGFQENPYKYMKYANVYCSASTKEGFSLVIAEAMILGLPIVAIESCGPDELLNNGEYGILVKDSDEDLCNALREILTNESEYVHYKKQSISRKIFFDTKVRINEMMDYFESLIER